MPELHNHSTRRCWPLRLLDALDRLTEHTGRAIAWLTLAMVLLTCAVVFMRRGLDIGATGLQEAVLYMHAAVFMLGAAYALKHREQVRVDIFYRRFSSRQRAWVDSLGGVVFLAPLCLFIALISWQFVADAWRIREASTDSGGLGYVYMLKTLIPLAALSLLLQACAEILRSLLLLMGLLAAEEEQADSEVAL